MDTIDIVFTSKDELMFIRSIQKMYHKDLLITLVSDGLIYSLNQKAEEIFEQMQEHLDKDLK